MKKIIYSMCIILLSLILTIPQVIANEISNDTIGILTEESKTVEQNGNVFVEMQIDDIDNIKSVTGDIASKSDTETHIQIKLENTTQGKWYYFVVPANTIVGETYTIPMINVEYNDGTNITGNVSGEFQIIKRDITKTIGSITEDSKTAKQNGNVFVEMQIDDIDNIKSVTGDIASKSDTETHIQIKLENTTQGKWYYFVVPANTIVGETYTIPMINVEYNDGTTITGIISGEFKIIEENTSKGDNIVKDNLDNTIAKNVLPKTGKEMKVVIFIAFALVLVVISFFSYLIFKKYSNI